MHETGSLQLHRCMWKLIDDFTLKNWNLALQFLNRKQRLHVCEVCKSWLQTHVDRKFGLGWKTPHKSKTQNQRVSQQSENFCSKLLFCVGGKKYNTLKVSTQFNLCKSWSPPTRGRLASEKEKYTHKFWGRRLQDYYPTVVKTLSCQWKSRWGGKQGLKSINSLATHLPSPSHTWQTELLLQAWHTAGCWE